MYLLDKGIMVKKLCCLLIISTFLYADIAYPLSKTDSLQDAKFRQCIATLTSFLDYVKDHPDSTLQKIGAELKANVTRGASGVWLDKDNFKMRFFNPARTTISELDAGDELIYEDVINDRLKVQVYFKGLNAKDKSAVRAFLSNNPGISSLGRMVLEEIAGTTGPKGTSYKKQTDSKIITYISDTEGVVRPVAIYTLINPRFKEVCIDFSEGEKPYAYVDTEERKIKLLNPDDRRIDLDKIKELMNIELTIDNEMEIDSPMEEPVKKPPDRPVSKGADIEGKLSQELRSRLEENRAINKGVREFIKALGGRGVVTRTGDVFQESDFNRMLLIYDKDELLDMFERILGIDPRIAGKIIDYAFEILEYREEVTAQYLEYVIMPSFVEDVLIGIFNEEYQFECSSSIVKVRSFGSTLARPDVTSGRSSTAEAALNSVEDCEKTVSPGMPGALAAVKRIGFTECFGYANEGWDSLCNVLKNSRKTGETRKLDEFIAEQVADVVLDVYLSLGKDEGINEFVERIVQLDISKYMSPPTTRHRYIKKFRVKGGDAIDADERTFEAVLDSMGIYRGLNFLAEKEEEERATGSDLFLSLFDYLGSFEIGPKKYIPVQVEDAWRSFNLWKKRAGEVTYEDVQRKFLELYMRYIKDGKDDMQRWGWTFLWLCYYEEGSRMYNAVSSLLKEVSLKQDVDISTIVDELCDRYKLNNEERQKLLVAAPIDGFIMLVEIYCRDAMSGRFGLLELEERLMREMNAVTDEDVEGEEILNGDVSNWLYTFRNIPDELEEVIKEKLKTEVVELILGVVQGLNLKCSRSDLEHLLDSIYSTRLPSTGERFIDNVPIIDLCKILFDYARCMVKDDQALKKLHSAKNLDLSYSASHFYKDLKDKDAILTNALTAANVLGMPGDTVFLRAFRRPKGCIPVGQSSTELRATSAVLAPTHIGASVEPKARTLTGIKKETEFLPYSRANLNEFYAELKSCKKLVMFVHKHTETVGLLFWIQELLKENPDLEIRIIPQKSLWELNSTREDIITFLEKEQRLSADQRQFEELISYWQNGRFVILDDCAPGLSWLKGAERTMVKEEIGNADIVLGIGWDNFVSLQGLNRPSYFGFSVDDSIKEKLTGCKVNEPVFIKTCGGIPAIQIGAYNLHEYLISTNSESYMQLLSYFGGDRIKLHEWIKREAKRTGKGEIDIMRSEVYYKEPVKVFGDCALSEVDSDLREEALDILLNNSERFGIRKEINTISVKLGNIQIQTGVQVDCYYLPDRLAAILVKDGRRLVIEVFEGEDEIRHLRIGDKGYRVEGLVKVRSFGSTRTSTVSEATPVCAEVALNSVEDYEKTVSPGMPGSPAAVDLVNIFLEPALWIGNSGLVEFFSAFSIHGLVGKGRGPPGVSIKDIPQYINCQIPQTKPSFIYEIAEEFLVNPIPYLPLQLHYAIVLLSSPNITQRVKGINELERLRATGDKEILDIMKFKGLSRVTDWINDEVPSVDSDIFSLANFTSEQERILRILGGGYLLRPPLVVMPGQGVSMQFHNAVSREIARLGVGLVRSNYAEGSGSILFQDGIRHYVRTGDLLLELSKKILAGQMLGAVRLKQDEGEIIQVPVNAGILNYLKIIHHLAHITAGRLVEAHGEKIDPLQEFTPTIEDVLIIKYMQRLVGNLKDGFSDFKEEISNTGDERGVRTVFERYGLNYPIGKDFAGIKTEILKLKDMQGFSVYIEDNNLGNFISVKEFLNVLIDYTRGSVEGYIRQLPPQKQIILERLLLADSDSEINNLLIIASLLAGCYIPKVDFKKDMEIITGLLGRPKMATGVSKDAILKRIDQILEGGEPFSAKAVRIVGTILYKMGIKVNAEERREIEGKVMEILSGKWLQTLEESLRERLVELENSGVDTGDLREKLGEISSYMIGESQRLGKLQPQETKPTDIDEIRSWGEIEKYIDRYKIERVFIDIDKTILDAPGYITTTPWFREMTGKKGLEETIGLWRELEEGLVERGMIHRMEDCIPEVINMLKGKGVKVFLYTARGEDDLSRTEKMLKSIGIDMEGVEIIISKGGAPEQKRDALVEYYRAKGWFKEKRVPSLYMDDTLANVKAVCGDKRFSHIKGLWYRAPYQKQYDRLTPEQFLEEGDMALRSGKTMEALEWYYNAFYVRSRKDIVNMVYDVVAGHMGIESCLEDLFYRFIKDRLNRYGSALERESVWTPAIPEKKPEEKDIIWFEGAPDAAGSEFWQGVKRIIVIGSHPHGDHVKGFIDYAKRRMKNIVETAPPGPSQMKTGGPITHSLSNYWGRIGEETIVLFDLGWFPEGFVDPLIQTVHPRDREIFFIMDPDTERTLDFKSQLGKLKLEGVKFQVLPYENILNIPVEKGRILQIENYPAYHLAPEVGSSIYIVRMLDANTGLEIQSIGYISELGDIFPEKVDKELLEKFARLDHIIVDGTNLIAPMGGEPLPLKERPNKVHKYVKRLNQGRFLIAHFNTPSIRMGEEAAIVSENLNPDIPIVVIGGKDAIEQLKRVYKVPKGMNYYTIGNKKIYLVHDVADFHRKLREEGNIPKLDDVLDERIKGLKRAGWTDTEISEFVREWRDADGKEIVEYKGPEGKVKEIAALLWDLRKTQAVIISSSQFRGNPKEKRYQNFKGFQILDAIVDKKDVCILIEGRLHMDDEEGAILKILLDKDKDREIPSITGQKKVRATIDNQWRSGHITFRQLMVLLSRIADKSVELGNTYNVRTYIPVPQCEWFSVIPEDEARGLLQKFNRKSLEDVIEIINRWNNRSDVSDVEILFVKKVVKKIFEQAVFWKKYFNISNAEALRDELLGRLDMVKQEIRLNGRANNRIFVASTSKFVEVLKRQLSMDPDKKSELFNIAGRFIGFEVGISYEQGKTIDFVKREKEEYSRNLIEDLNRGCLKDLYSRAERGEVPSDLSEYRKKGIKGLEEYRMELVELLDKAEGRAKRQKKEVFGIWFSGLKGYIESQFLRIGLRYVDKVVSYSDLRRELSLLYDAVIESVYNYLQQDMGWEYKDISIIAGGDYAQHKALFSDAILLGILAGDKVDKGYTERLYNRMKGILNKLGIPIEFSPPMEGPSKFGDLSQVLHKRTVASGSEEEEKIKAEVGKPRPLQERGKDIMTKREERFSEDVKVLKDRKGFDIHIGPGGLDDIELIRMFYSTSINEDERSVLDETEEFLRRYKEEVGLSTGGDREKAKELFKEIMTNLGFMGTGREFKEDFFRRVGRVYMILRKVMSMRQSKNLSFGPVNEIEDIHKGVFEKAAREGRLFREEDIDKIDNQDVKKGFELLRQIRRGNTALESRRYAIVVEESGAPTLFYSEEPFRSVLSHGGKRTNTIYLGLNTLLLAGQKPQYRNALRNIMLHDNRDIERGYHMDLDDEVKEGIITYTDVDDIYMLWNDLITNGRFSNMNDLYLSREKERRYSEFFLERIPANIRIITGRNLYEFQHGDTKDLPDTIGLNIRLFEGNFSPETQVFLLRHCTDRIRYDKYKTIINDVKYLLKVSEMEREKILSELKELEYAVFLSEILKTPEQAKEKIREYLGLSFKSYTSPDGADIWYSVGGNPNAERTLVFLHGLGVNSRDWRHQITLFEEEYKIITIDLRGFGKSKGLGSKPPHIKNYAEDVDGILIKEGIKDAVLVGHSMGGMVGLNMDEIYTDIPLEKRRIKGLVLIATDASDPMKRFPRVVKEIIFKIIQSKKFEMIWESRIFKWLIKRSSVAPIVREIAELLGITQRETHPLFTRKVISSVFKTNERSLEYALKSMEKHDVEDNLSNLKIPVLWIIGDKDKAALPQEQKEQAGKISNCTVAVISEAYHYPHATFPRRVNKDIYNFINGGTYRFSQLVREQIRNIFSIDVSLDELGTELNSIKIRLIPKLNAVREEDLRLIDDISRIIMQCGLETGVSNEIMIKAVMIVANQITPKAPVAVPPVRPISHEDLESLYGYIAHSV